MDATLKLKAEQLAGDIASQAKTLDDLNGLLRTLMRCALERMLDEAGMSQAVSSHAARQMGRRAG